jgi:copper chaperone
MIASEGQTMCELHVEYGPGDAKAYKPSIAGTTFAVLDMTCSHCVETVRAAIANALPGAAVDVSLAAQRVTVAGDEAIAAAAIRAAGYTPELVTR